MVKLNRKRVLFSVLNWGLGHATRSIPLIKALKKKNELFIASTGRSLILLEQEFPEITFFDLPDYKVRHTKNGFLLIPFLALQVPFILFRIIKEIIQTEKLVKKYNIDLIISDNRYGVFSRFIPSFFITHQLRFKLPKVLKKFEFLSEWYNRLFFKRYKRIFIIDSKENQSLSGELSNKGKITHHNKLVYLGILSSITRNNQSNPINAIDVLFSISGPEPQRTYFEKTILNQINKIDGRKVVVLGKPDDTSSYKRLNDLEIYSHVSREKMSELMNRAKLIVSRSGYSTVMEIVALGKKALLVPTPGQTEQEYLADYYQYKGLFHIASQKNLDLKKEIDIAQNFGVSNLSGIHINDTEKFLKFIGE